MQAVFSFFPRRFVINILLTFLLAGLLIGAVTPNVTAQEVTTQESTAQAILSPTAWEEQEHARLRVIPLAGKESSFSGKTLELAIEIQLAEGWKTYWRSPGDAGLPLSADWEKESANIESVTFHWPAPVRVVESWGLESYGFKHRLVLPMTLIRKDAGEEATFQAEINYSVCSDICIPYTDKVSLTLPAGEITPVAEGVEPFTDFLKRVPLPNGGNGMELKQVKATQPEENKGTLTLTAERAEGFSDPDLFVEGRNGIRFPRPEVSLSDDRKTASFTFTYELTVPIYRLEQAPLTLTLVDDARAVEAVIPVEAGIFKEGMKIPVASEKPVITGKKASAKEAPAKEVPATTNESAADPEPSEGGGLAWVLFSAFLGGILLNVMPCVLPVITLKLLGIAKHGGGLKRETRLHLLAGAAGILVSFLVLAGLTLVAKQAGAAVGWGFHFQEPLFLTALTVIILLFAANLFGWFEIQLPGGLASKAYEASQGDMQRYSGSFASGVLATVLATPCSAPFLGTAVGFALSRGALEIVLVFLMLGLGLAFPFLLVALFPGLATRLPKPGAWMVKVKVILGLLLLLTAGWLISVVALQMGRDSALVLLVAGVTLLLALWLKHRTEKSRKLLVLAVALLVLVALLMPARLRVDPQSFAVTCTEVATCEWLDFSEQRLERFRSENRVVLVDITADWCLTCKTNKLVVFSRKEFDHLMHHYQAVALRGDWTNRNEEIRRYLAAHGRFGIPFNIVYGPGAPQGIVLSELLSLEALEAALKQASGEGANLPAGKGADE